MIRPTLVYEVMLFAWVGSEILIFRRDWQPGKGRQDDRGSRVVIFVAMAVAINLAVQFARVARFPGPALAWSFVGAVLMAFGIFLRQRAVRWLGQFFRTHVTLLDEHQLIEDGPYRRVRHPSYTGGLISCFALGVAIGSAASVAAMLLIPVAGFVYRIVVEERALAIHFGDRWTAYRARTAALIPGLW